MYVEGFLLTLQASKDDYSSLLLRHKKQCEDFRNKLSSQYLMKVEGHRDIMESNTSPTTVCCTKHPGVDTVTIDLCCYKTMCDKL